MFEKLFGEPPVYDGLSTDVRGLLEKTNKASPRCVTGHDGPDPEGTGFMTLDGHSFADLADDREAWAKRAQEIRDHRRKCYDEIMAARQDLVNGRSDDLKSAILGGDISEGTIIRGKSIPGERGASFEDVTVFVMEAVTGKLPYIGGRIILDGKVTRKKCGVDTLGPIEIVTDLKIEGDHVPLAARIGMLEPGGEVEIYDHPISSVRVTASREGNARNRRFMVSGAGAGCKVIRIDGATPEMLDAIERPKRGAPRDPDSLPSVLRDMEVGDIISLGKDEYRLSTIRVAAYNIGAEENRRYTVNRTPTGCKVTRME